jgi:hypothetical protein
MSSLAKLTRLLPILFIVLFACQPEEEQFMENDPDQLEIENFIADAEEVFLEPSARLMEDIELCGDPLELSLKHYRYNAVGKAIISNSIESLVINFEANDGMVLDRTILVLILERKNMIMGKDLFNKDKYSKVMFSFKHNSDISDYLYEIPKSLLGEDIECVSMIAIAMVKEQNSDRRRTMFAFARQEQNSDKFRFRDFFIEYCLQACSVPEIEPEPEPEPEACAVQCTYGFAIPSVDIAKSYSFEDLGIMDWGWGYVHEIKDETLFRLPIKQEDSESASTIGQVTVMIDNDIAYVYYQMNDGYPMNKISIYFSHAEPDSGIPCNYTFERTYTNPDGTWQPTLTDTYMIENVSEILAKSGDANDPTNNNNKKLYLAAYVDFCE